MIIIVSGIYQSFCVVFVSLLSLSLNPCVCLFLFSFSLFSQVPGLEDWTYFRTHALLSPPCTPPSSNPNLISLSCLTPPPLSSCLVLSCFSRGMSWDRRGCRWVVGVYLEIKSTSLRRKTGKNGQSAWQPSYSSLPLKSFSLIAQMGHIEQFYRGTSLDFYLTF